MKRIICATLALMLLLAAVLSCSAADIEIADDGKTVIVYGDWIIEKINDDTQWNLDSYSGTSAEVYSPSIINGLIVISFGDHCFANNTTVKSVVTSSPLWIVGEYAFNNCTALESFECNYAMHTIGVGAFSGTSALNNINLEDSVVTELKAYAFMDSGLETISLPETCTKIDEYAFAQCYNLSRIDIPSSVTQIADTAFSRDENLVIYANHDAYAIEYAKAQNIPYVLLDVEEVTFILGDADGDGDVTILDATKVQRVLADLDADPDGMIALRADSDEDELDIMDATRIQRWLAEYEVAEPIGDRVNRTIPLKEKEAEYPQNDSEASTESSTEILTE